LPGDGLYRGVRRSPSWSGARSHCSVLSTLNRGPTPTPGFDSSGPRFVRSFP
jgi:hypothetical protein